MEIRTFSIVAGSAACNARCPFCVARMTGLVLANQQPAVNWRNFEKACGLADMKDVTTILITGKGEPTLFPEQITEFLQRLEAWSFPLIDLQTNGKLIASDKYNNFLDEWWDLGMSTIALSVVHYEAARNQEVYQFTDGFYDLPKLIKKLRNIRGHGFSVRLTLMLLDGFIDSPAELLRTVNFCKEHGVNQLTIRPIVEPATADDKEASQFVKERGISYDKQRVIGDYLRRNASLIRTLPHGGLVYDHVGQNVCLANCLTIEPEGDDQRQMIFFPDGSLRHDWQYKGAVLL